MNSTPEKSTALLFFQNNNPLGVYDACCKKEKDCCKKFKKGDRCKKCPRKK